MKTYFKVAGILGLICAVAAVILAWVNSVTAPKIAEYDQSQTLMALEAVSGGFGIGEKRFDDTSDTVSYIIPLTQNGKSAGYILELNATGYGGAMKLVASYDLAGEIIAVKMLSNSETPGIGKKSEDPSYMDKFIGTGGDGEVPTSKSQLSSDQAQAVSGATVTFTGISKALDYGSDYVRKQGGR